MVDHRERERLLHHEIGLGEAAIEIAARVAVLVADVGPGDRLERGEVAEVDRRPRALVEYGRARRQRGVERIDDG